jgi:hypothetical protein
MISAYDDPLSNPSTVLKVEWQLQRCKNGRPIDIRHQLKQLKQLGKLEKLEKLKLIATN